MRKIQLFVSIIAVAMLTACSNALPSPEDVKVNPSPLELVGSTVNADITGTFPVKKFNRKGILTVTPVLKYNGQEAVGEPVTYVGEKVKENGVTVNFKEGGSYSQSCSFKYVPEMAKSELYLRFSAKVGRKVVEIPDLKIADGVLNTKELVSAEENEPAVTPDKFQRIIQEMQEADIKFLIQQANLRQSETRSAEMKSLTAAIKDANKDEKKAINKLEVSGYASPDGGVDLNAKLANQRQAVAQKFLKQQLKQNKINSDIESTVTAEDWEGFQKAVEASNLPEKDLVLRVLSMYNDPEEREAQIKNLSNVYKTIADEILPSLRRSRLILTTDLIGKSDEEILALVKEDPAQLNVEELLYAATLVEDNAQKMAVYQKVIELYNDYRAYNNEGLIYFAQGNLDEAAKCYANALALNANDADVHFNAGICAMAQNDLVAAEEHLGKAAGTTGDLNAALGTLYTMKGDYKSASAAYGNKATNNAAVQHILNENYAAARQALANVEEPNATTAYLMAIVGARTNDRETVYTNLKLAIERDAQLKVRAADDIEFAKYVADEEFQAITK
ncbi:MAG: tetratricopeptide repeat protein [Paludibacteraceae bacterium]|nr:tetratricopeptide repeat protein [Paludibacteraceae bacterium]